MKGDAKIRLAGGDVRGRIALVPEPSDPASMMRVIDESGEDYLYPASWFVPMDLPPKVRRALAAA